MSSTEKNNIFHNVFIYLSTLLPIVIALSLKAEDNQGKSKPVVFYHLFDEPYELRHVDTLISDIHFYNPVDRPESFSLHTGNVGGPNQSFHHFEIPEFGFNHAPAQLGHWERNLQTLRVLQNEFPYTKMNLLFGTDQRVMARAVHSQPIGRGVHISGDFQRINAGGSFARQRNLNNHLSLHLNYISPQGNYTADAGFFMNNHRGQENGGLQDVDVLSNQPGINLDIVPIRSANAERTNQNNSFFVQQAWKFGEPAQFEEDDTLIQLPQFSPFSFYHRYTHRNQAYMFRDNNPDIQFYPDSYALPADSIYRRSRGIENAQRIGLKGTLGKRFETVELTDTNAVEPTAPERFFYYDLYTGGALVEHRLKFQTTNYAQLQSGIDFGYRNSFFNGYFSAAVITDGYNDGDYFVKSGGNVLFDSVIQLGLDYHFQSSAPAFVYHRLQSNVLSYENDFEKVKAHSVKGEANWLPAKLNLNFAASHIQHHVFLADRGRVEQLENGFWDLNVSLSHQLKSGRFGLENTAGYRHLTDRTAYDVPEFYFFHSIFYENELFNQALMFRLGLNIRHHTPFYVQGYDPLTNDFYAQKDWKPAYHPVADLFLNLKIQTVRISAALTHLNARLYPSETAWAAYRYPVANRSFQLGIYWLFYN